MTEPVYKPVPKLADYFAKVAAQGFRVAELGQDDHGWHAVLDDGEAQYRGDGVAIQDTLLYAMRKRAPKAAEMFE